MNTQSNSMKSYDCFTIAAFQGRCKEGDPKSNFVKVMELMKESEERKIDILCLPESFLHGYFSCKDQALQYSIDLKSDEFHALCDKLKIFSRTTLLLGLNEKHNDELFNTVVVIENGHCLGKYRKAYTYPPYDYYSLGCDFPVFEKHGVKYSVIICLDSVYREPSLISALSGAQILFCPMFNRVSNDARMLHYLNRKSHFVSRAFDNQCWFVASDIVWDENDSQVCQGYATILDDDGQVVAQSQPFQEMLLSYSIPIKYLTGEKSIKRTRRYGNPELFEKVKLAYENAISRK